MNPDAHMERSEIWCTGKIRIHQRYERMRDGLCKKRLVLVSYCTLLM